MYLFERIGNYTVYTLSIYCIKRKKKKKTTHKTKQTYYYYVFVYVPTDITMEIMDYGFGLWKQNDNIKGK